MTNTKPANPWTWDLRVRDRNLRAGTVEAKDVEKYLGGLPDLAENATPFTVDPPNFDPPDDVDDEEDGDLDDADEE
jgi:hypothetical protein